MTDASTIVARPTMRDVAALAGVAIKTVSRVLNGEPSVNPELAARVHTAAEKLGYRPNLVASSLRRGDGRTSTIGMLVEDVANPFSAGLLRAVENVARERDILVLIGSVEEDPDRERVVAQRLIDRNVDGLILVPAGHDQSYLLAETRRGARVVFVDREPQLFAADAIVSDNVGGARMATEHLLARGHRRIGYLGDVFEIATASRRFDGYVQALERAGVPFDPALTRHDLPTVAAAARAAGALLDQADPPTALFTSQNLVTIGTIHALRARGRQHSVAVVGFDDFLLGDLLDPPVTVIAQDVRELGRQAAERLFARLDGDETPASVHVVPTRLVPRGSGEIPAPAAASGPARRG